MALFASVLKTAIDAIITIDERGMIQHANKAVENLFGYPVEEVIGRNVSMLMPEPDRARHNHYIGHYLETRQPSIIGIGRQVMGQRKDGSLIHVDLAVSELQIGGKTLFTGILRDMTARNRTEAALRLAEQRIIQNERLAAIGQMMTGLAHESRNALQRSRACLDMLELDLEPKSEQMDLVRRTRAALLELQTLYEEVRQYAAPIVLEKSLLQLDSLCLEVWGHLKEERGPLSVELELQCDDCPPCRVDRQRMCQVLRNVLENSLAVSPPGSKIQVLCREVKKVAESVIQVRVLDEGTGIDLAHREWVFEPFYTTKTKGTGLGLAICKRIIEAHGGNIAIGNPPKGAEVIIELPLE